MNDEDKGVDAEAVLAAAIHDESRYFFALSWRDSDEAEHVGDVLQAHLDRHAAAMFGAALGAAKRFVRDHQEVAPSTIQQLARTADAISTRLPVRLVPLWQTHYLDGCPLAAYAAAAGVDAAVAESDYRDVIRALVPAAREMSTVKPTPRTAGLSTCA
jgi:hypothetical protein